MKWGKLHEWINEEKEKSDTRYQKHGTGSRQL